MHDVVFGEDKSQVRNRNTPAVLAAVRDLIRHALKLARYVNTAAGRRSHTDAAASSPSTASHNQPDIQGKRRGPELQPGQLPRPGQEVHMRIDFLSPAHLKVRRLCRRTFKLFHS